MSTGMLGIYRLHKLAFFPLERLPNSMHMMAAQRGRAKIAQAIIIWHFLTFESSSLQAKLPSSKSVLFACNCAHAMLLKGTINFMKNGGGRVGRKVIRSGKDRS